MAHTDNGTILLDSQAICEFFDETVERAPMIAGTAADRAEVRRLVSWFDHKMFAEVVGNALLHERMEKRLIHRAAPDGGQLREAMRLANAHLDYMDYLLDHRRWLAGSVFSLADLAGAAHLSVADYSRRDRLARSRPDRAMVCRPEVTAELPAIAQRAYGSDQPAGALRQGRFLLSAWLGSRHACQIIDAPVL